jgi:hypothetical protein
MKLKNKLQTTSKLIVKILPFFALFSYSSFSQTTTTGNSSGRNANPIYRIETDVFVLDACDLVEMYIIKSNHDSSTYLSKKARNLKLEVKANKLSAFKINGINPLRYKYYINSEAVTQFMDVNPQVSQLSTFLRDGYFASPFEINIPQIFKEEVEKNNKRVNLEPIRKQIDEAKDSLVRYQIEVIRIEDENPYPPMRYDSIGNPILPTDKERDRIAETNRKTSRARANFDKWEKKLYSLLDDFENQIITLPISGSDLSILGDYKVRHDSSFKSNPDVTKIEKYIREFALQYERLKEDFKKVDSFLNLVTNPSSRSSIPSNADSMNSLLHKLGYTLSIDRYSIGSKSTTIRINIKEFLIKKRYQVFEEFVLGTATRIGTMLQSSFRKVSQQTNSLRLQNCIDSTNISKIKAIKSELGEVFDFVQKSSAEFQILVSYLDIDSKLYASLAKSINTNYYLLLNYLKIMDLIEENNIVEYTLPSSTNLKNIDLVRYKVDREDKITGGKQTYTYDLWVRGGMKIDFSFGIFASGLIDSKYQKYQYDRLGVITDSVQVVRQNSGGYNFGFGGMVNVTPRLGGSWLTPGLSFGVIYSTNQKLQFLSAISLQLGKAERLVLHGGVAFGLVETLDQSQHKWSVVEKDVIYRVKADVNQFSVPVIEKFSVKPVFGLTYNLSKRNALQAVSSDGLTKYRELNPDSGIKTVAQ